MKVNSFCCVKTNQKESLIVENVAFIQCGRRLFEGRVYF